MRREKEQGPKSPEERAQERAERARKNETWKQRKLENAADPNGVAFIAMTAEAKVLASVTEQLDVAFRRIRARSGRGIDRVKADTLIDEGLAVTIALHNFTQRAAKLADIRYFEHPELRNIKQTARVEMVEVKQPEKNQAKKPVRDREKGPVPAPVAETLIVTGHSVDQPAAPA